MHKHKHMNRFTMAIDSTLQYLIDGFIYFIIHFSHCGNRKAICMLNFSYKNNLISAFKGRNWHFIRLGKLNRFNRRMYEYV